MLQGVTPALGAGTAGFDSLRPDEMPSCDIHETRGRTGDRSSRRAARTMKCATATDRRTTELAGIFFAGAAGREPGSASRGLVGTNPIARSDAGAARRGAGLPSRLGWVRLPSPARCRRGPAATTPSPYLGNASATLAGGSNVFMVVVRFQAGFTSRCSSRRGNRALNPATRVRSPHAIRHVRFI